MTARFAFGSFVLDTGERTLTSDGAPIELNTRYLDALALLVRDAGKLVPKERFLDEVWRGVPVTGEALTQCIRTLRRQLGDDDVRRPEIDGDVRHRADPGRRVRRRSRNDRRGTPKRLTTTCSHQFMWQVATSK